LNTPKEADTRTFVTLYPTQAPSSIVSESAYTDFSPLAESSVGDTDRVRSKESQEEGASNRPRHHEGRVSSITAASGERQVTDKRPLCLTCFLDRRLASGASDTHPQDLWSSILISLSFLCSIPANNTLVVGQSCMCPSPKTTS
jgi:hypothetical protein